MFYENLELEFSLLTTVKYVFFDSVVSALTRKTNLLIRKLWSNINHFVTRYISLPTLLTAVCQVIKAPLYNAHDFY